MPVLADVEEDEDEAAATFPAGVGDGGGDDDFTRPAAGDVSAEETAGTDAPPALESGRAPDDDVGLSDLGGSTTASWPGPCWLEPLIGDLTPFFAAFFDLFVDFLDRPLGDAPSTAPVNGTAATSA